jgi:hypothetical protein
MFHRWHVGRILVIVALFVLLLAGLSAVRRWSWWRGYEVGRLEGGSDERAAPSRWLYWGFRYSRPRLGVVPWLFALGLLFRAGLFILILGGIAWLLRPRRWWASPPRHWPGYHGPTPPGQHAPGEPRKEWTAKVKPDQDVNRDS